MEVNDGDRTNQNTENYEIKIIRDQMEEHINDVMFRELSSSSFSWECSIYRVPKLLRHVNPKAYTPQVISIGPLHHSENDRMIMEKKGAYVLNFLALAKLSWDEVIKRVISWEERARNCYVEPINMDRGQFVQLLILDGCFVVLYIIGSLFPEFRDIDTGFLWRFNNGIFKDLLLLENQLPFFLLRALYDMCASSQPSLKNFSFIELVRSYFRKAREGMSYLERGFHIDASEVNHLVDFLRIHLTHPRSPQFLDLIGNSSLFSIWPPTATELHDCGISFKKNKLYYIRRKCMMDMYFEEGCSILKMPQIIIDDSFEISLRNIMAYEYCHLKSKDVSNFAMFMKFLINTNKDVSLLINDGIMQNHVGSTNEITRLFDDLCKHITVERNVYNFECQEMKEYCKRRRHRWMTSLKRDYFGTPWAFISFIAAVLLLFLTFVQTLVSVIQLYK